MTCQTCDILLRELATAQLIISQLQAEVLSLKRTFAGVRRELEREGYHYPNPVLCRVYDALEVGPDWVRED